MGLMDKVKAQATMAAQKAQEAAQQGKDKLDQAQATRRGDAMLRQLGAAVFAERTGRGGPDSQAKIEQLISEISAHERANGLNLAGDQSQQAAPQPNFPPADPPSPFPGPPAGTTPGAGTSSFPDAGSTSFPDAGPTAFPDAGSDAGPTAFPDAGPAASRDTSAMFFPASESGSEAEPGGTSSFPPEG
jgi:hypothetical protein